MSETLHNEEKELFARIALSDEPAFRELYYLYGRLLFPFLLRLTGTEDTADEIIQEVFLRIWLHRDRLADVDNPRAWTFRIASNLAHTWLRRKVLAEKAARETRQPGTEDSTEDFVSTNAIRAIVLQTIAAMPPQRQLIYRLHRDQGRKIGEIAAELDISTSTVKNTLAAALRVIRAALQRAGYGSWLILLLLKK